MQTANLLTLLLACRVFTAEAVYKLKWLGDYQTGKDW